MNTHCIFCTNELNGSDEHIIPQSINGQLHSKNLICSDCNNLFGTKVDPVIKETLSFLLHALKIGNVRNLAVQDEEGTSYLVDNVTGEVKHLKPEINMVQRDDGKIEINVSGPDEIGTYKALATKAVRTFGTAALKGEYSVSKSTKINTGLSASVEIKITPKLLLALNKIIIEYYCYSNLERELIKPLITDVGKLDEGLTNIKICNTSHNVRKPGNTEISHLIIIRSDETRKIIYGYVEIFNSICGYTVLVENYEGDKIDFMYHQDALTKAILSEEININLDAIEVQPAELGNNINMLLSRYEDRHVYEQVSLICKEIKDELDVELSKGSINKEDHEKIYIEKSTKAIAHLMVFVYPDNVADFDEKELKEIHYIHSLIREDKIEEFNFFYHQFIGHEFIFEDDDAMYKMEEFIFAKHRPRNNISMRKVYCCFVSQKDGSKKYLLATDVFKFTGVPFLRDEFKWL